MTFTDENENQVKVTRPKTVTLLMKLGLEPMSVWKRSEVFLRT